MTIRFGFSAERRRISSACPNGRAKGRSRPSRSIERQRAIEPQPAASLHVEEKEQRVGTLRHDLSAPFDPEIIPEGECFAYGGIPLEVDPFVDPFEQTRSRSRDVTPREPRTSVIRTETAPAETTGLETVGDSFGIQDLGLGELFDDTFERRDDIPGVDPRTAASAIGDGRNVVMGIRNDRRTGIRSDYGNAADLRAIQRQQPGIVAQQDDPLLGGLVADPVCLGVEQRDGGVLLGTVEESHPETRGIDVPHLRIDSLPVKASVAEHRQHLFTDKSAVASHFQVQIRTYRTCRVDARPVGHQYSVKPPFFAEQIRQERVFGHVGAVHEVVSRHYGLDPGLLHGGPKGREVNFTQRPFRDFGADPITVELLVVAHEMFDRGDDAPPAGRPG